MYCERCGEKLSDDACFCHKCGQAVRHLEEKDLPNDYANPPDKASASTLSEEETVEAICPQCGFNGKMQIVEKNNIAGGNKILLYIICYGGLFALAYVLEIILVPLFPTWILYVFGFVLGGSAIKAISGFVKRADIKRVKCPHCKQILEYKQK